MLIYIGLVVAVCFLFLFKNKKRSLLLSFLLITIIASLRNSSVGVDTQQFCNAFSDIGKAGWGDYNKFRYEVGFYYLCKVLYVISANPQILIVATSVIINLAVYCFIKDNSPNYFLSVLLYIIMNIFFSYMNVMRQALAISVLLFGYKFIVKKHYIKYLITIFIASLFHTVAWAALLLMFYSLLPRKKWVYVVSFTTAIALFVFYKQFFDLLTSIFGYSGYSESEYGKSNYFGSLLSFAETLIIFAIICFFAFYKYNRNNRLIKPLSQRLYIDVVAVIIYLIFLMLTMRMNIFNRVSGLYGIYCLVFIPEILQIVKSRSNFNYKILSVSVVGIYLASFIIICLLRPDWYGCVPYSFFFAG